MIARTYYINTPNPDEVIAVRVYSNAEPEQVSAEILVKTIGNQWEPKSRLNPYIETSAKTKPFDGSKSILTSADGR